MGKSDSLFTCVLFTRSKQGDTKNKWFCSLFLPCHKSSIMVASKSGLPSFLSDVQIGRSTRYSVGRKNEEPTQHQKYAKLFFSMLYTVPTYLQFNTISKKHTPYFPKETLNLVQPGSITKAKVILPFFFCVQQHNGTHSFHETS